MSKYLVNGNVTIEIDDNGGTPRDITAHVTEIDDFGKEYRDIDDTVFSDTAESVIAGIEASQQFSVSGWLDDAANTGSDTVLNDAPGNIRTVKLTAKSSVRSFAAEMLCTSFKMSGAINNFIRFTATFKQDGAVTVGT